MLSNGYTYKSPGQHCTEYYGLCRATLVRYPPIRGDWIIASSRRRLDQYCHLSSLCKHNAFLYPFRWSSQIVLSKMPLCSTLHIVQSSLSHCCLNLELCPLPAPCFPINMVIQNCMVFCSIVELITLSIPPTSEPANPSVPHVVFIDLPINRAAIYIRSLCYGFLHC